MKRDNIFWGGVLILFGVLFLLQTQGLINNVFRLFWPLMLILVGGWIVLGVYWKPAISASETFSVPLREAKSVRYNFSHGAAQIEIAGNAPAGMAMVGSSAAGMNHQSRLDGDRLDVKIETGPSMIPFLGPNGGLWRYQITKDVPVTLTIEAGASTFEIDLKDTLATRTEVKVGASTVNLTLPARGVSVLDIEGGAATFNLRVPDGTTARISARDGFSALNVDKNRFAEIAMGVYESPNFNSSSDRCEISIKAGMASVTVK